MQPNLEPSRVDDAVAVLLIDMQHSFVGELSKKARVSLINSQSHLIRRCAEVDVPLVVVEYVDEGPTVDGLQCEINKVPRTRFVIKNSDDGFWNTSLLVELQCLNIEALVFTGINASCCVLKTAKSAVRYGYRVTTTSGLIANDLSLEWLFSRSFRRKHRDWYASNGTYHHGSVRPEQLLPHPPLLR